MKKIYINPTISIVEIKIGKLMESGSIEEGNEYGGGEILSRGGFWDDEEEEY